MFFANVSARCQAQRKQEHDRNGGKCVQREREKRLNKTRRGRETKTEWQIKYKEKYR